MQPVAPDAGAAEPPAFLTKDDVAAALGLPLRTLTYWAWALREDKRYASFEIRKRGGGPRVIHAPIKPIKDIQRQLADILLGCYRTPNQVHGFVLNRSPVTNADVHLRKHWVLRVDIDDFFPSINFGRVRGVFMAYPFNYPEDVSTLLAQISCHRNQLPQGAPTSPIISNYVCRGLDRELAKLARTERCHYTRYADDLCFSTDRTVFPQILGAIEAGAPTAGVALNEIVEAHGFRLNGGKTRLMRRTQRQRVTGLVVNDRLNVSRQYVESLRNLLYIWRRYGEAAAAEALERTNPHPNWPPEKPRPSFKKVVRGRVQYIGRVKGWSSPVYVRLAAMLADVDDDFTSTIELPIAPSATSTSTATQPVRLFTEGDTDPAHLSAALRYFNSFGEFTDIAFVIDEKTPIGGDDKLLKFGRDLSRTRQAGPCVLLFDRDKPGVMASATDGTLSKSLGNGVVNVVISPPPWRKESELLCIEMLHPTDVLERDLDGRRVFLREEFDEDSGVHISKA